MAVYCTLQYIIHTYHKTRYKNNFDEMEKLPEMTHLTITYPISTQQSATIYHLAAASFHHYDYTPLKRKLELY